MRSTRLTSFLITFLFFVLGSGSATSENRTLPSDNSVESCSIINLIATPERYDGKRIETWGVARIAFEGNAIYLSAESAEHRTRVNGIYLALGDSGLQQSSARLDLRWVRVVGVFHKPAAGSPDWRGHIDEITDLYAPEDVEVER